MSASDEDPIWEKIKSQTKPLRRGQTNSGKPVPATKQVSSRPILDADLIYPEKQKPVSKNPAREDRHKRVKRGRIEIHHTLDLHGLTETAARQILHDCIVRRRGQTLLVITGKGQDGKGVLRQALPNWLVNSEMAMLVSGFAQAHTRHGGGGAWYVFVRKPA